MELKADPHAIEQILVNLVLNAIEATSNEVAGRKRVCIRLSSDNGDAHIDVLDRGPGVSPQVRAKLFEPFATDKPDGVGLGLTTARDLARSQGGEIELLEEAGQTCFRLRLPRLG